MWSVLNQEMVSFKLIFNLLLSLCIFIMMLVRLNLYCSIGLHILFLVTIYILTLYDHLLLLPFTQTQAVVMPLGSVLMVRYAKSLSACIAILSINIHVCMSHSQF